MMIANKSVLAALLAVFLGCFLVTEYADARGRGGGLRGGGARMTRGGPAASGSFNRSVARPSRRPSVDRPANRLPDQGYNRPSRDPSSQTIDRDKVDQRREEVRDNRQDYRDDRYDRIEDHYDDRRDWYEDRWRVGAYMSLGAWNRMSCPYTVVVIGNITYYDCYGTRYERVYRGSEITYIIVQ